MNNQDLINKFYSAFVEGNAEDMAACYHEDIVFQDPAFGKLSGSDASKMWEMLLSKKGSAPKISFSNVIADDEKGSAEWTAEYFFGPKKRKVVNNVSASFKFKDGKIVEHTDSFDLWKWSKQALGPAGLLMGWTPFMKSKIQNQTNSQLSAFTSKSAAK